MDLSVLHPVNSLDRNFKWKDRLNGLTGHLSCRILEWTGWYNQDLLQRLLGHYRLYQIFKKECDHNRYDHLCKPLAYIVDYRTSQRFKYVISSITSTIYYVATFGKLYAPLQIEGFNRLLVIDKPSILQEFLFNSENDFCAAIKKAFEKINSHNIFNQSEIRHILIQQRYEHKIYQNSSH